MNEQSSPLPPVPQDALEGIAYGDVPQTHTEATTPDILSGLDGMWDNRAQEGAYALAVMRRELKLNDPEQSELAVRILEKRPEDYDISVTADGKEFSASAFLRDKLQGKLTVLDIGSGGKNELDGIADEGATVEYLDSSPFPDSPGHIVGNATHLDYETGTVQGIYTRNCITEHSGDSEKILEEALRVLDPKNGVMIIATALSTGEAMRLTISEILPVLQRNGIDIATQCELIVQETESRHKVFTDVVLTQPEIFLTIKSQRAQVPSDR